MVYRPNMETSRSAKSIRQARQWGVGIITTSAGIGMMLSEIQRVKASINSPLTLSYLTLFAITGVLILLWIWATSKELDLCFEWLDPERYSPPSSLKETIMIAGIGIILGLLLFAARDPLYYGIVFTLYSAFVTYAYYYTKTEILQAIEASRRRLDAETGGDQAALGSEYRKGVDVLEKFFILRPQTMRHIIILFTSGLGMSFGLIWKLLGKEVFGILSYGILGITIVVSEIVIAKWRLDRDGALRPIEAEVSELSRAENSIRNS